MKILVCGGAGYVGGGLVNSLLDLGHTVRVYDALVFEDLYLKQVDLVVGDIRDHERLKPHLAWADVVYWLAAMVGDPACAHAPVLAKQINQTEVQWLAENYAGPLVFFSTCSVYGAQDALLDESSPTGPLSIYAQTKLAAEGVLAGRKGDTLIFRLGTLYGLGDQFARIRLDLAVNYLTLTAHTHSRVTVFGGDQYRPFLHVQDAGRIAAVAGTEWRATGIFNLKGENTTIANFVNLVLADHFPGLQVELRDQPFEDLRNYRVSSAKAETMLDLRAVLRATDGVRDIKALLDQGRLVNPDAPRFSNAMYLKSIANPQGALC